MDSQNIPQAAQQISIKAQTVQIEDLIKNGPKRNLV